MSNWKKMTKMLKDANKLQKEMDKLQDELGKETVTKTAGGGVVTCTVNLKKEIIELKIDEEVVDPEDVEMLQDLITAATNEALREAGEKMDDAMREVTKDFKFLGL